jgi:protein-S-isoprenylcysteine O-methyltransferase Ste14
MSALELKIPPPAVTLVFAVAAWVVSTFTPTIEVAALYRAPMAVSIALIGGGVTVAGVIAFRRAQTTINPMKPETASSLITGGIYRITRNPMYVGLLLVLVAWSVFLAAPWSLIAPVAFVAYMARFQIIPEERVLSSLFGEAYATYKAKVRRWL